MTKKQLQNIVSNYPDDCEITIKSSTNAAECDIVRITAEYESKSNFEVPVLILEYKKRDE